MLTNSPTARMYKLTENSFRDANVAFTNELALICTDQDINVLQPITLANGHLRVNILQPGLGMGHHGITVDPWLS